MPERICLNVDLTWEKSIFSNVFNFLSNDPRGPKGCYKIVLRFLNVFLASLEQLQERNWIRYHTKMYVLAIKTCKKYVSLSFWNLMRFSHCLSFLVVKLDTWYYNQYHFDKLIRNNVFIIFWFHHTLEVLKTYMNVWCVNEPWSL